MLGHRAGRRRGVVADLADPRRPYRLSDHPDRAAERAVPAHEGLTWSRSGSSAQPGQPHLRRRGGAAGLRRSLALPWWGGPGDDAARRRDGLLPRAGAALESARRLRRPRLGRPAGLCRARRLRVLLSDRRAERERLRGAAARRTVRGPDVDPGLVRGVSAARRVFRGRHLGRVRGVRAVARA